MHARRTLAAVVAAWRLRAARRRQLSVQSARLRAALAALLRPDQALRTRRVRSCWCLCALGMCSVTA